MELEGKHIHALVGILTLLPSGIMAWATVEMSAATDQIASLEEQRETIDLELMAVQKLDQNGTEWGFAVANHGLRDVGIASIDMRLYDGDGNVTLGGIAQRRREHSVSTAEWCRGEAGLGPRLGSRRVFFEQALVISTAL